MAPMPLTMAMRTLPMVWKHALICRCKKQSVWMVSFGFYSRARRRDDACVHGVTGIVRDGTYAGDDGTHFGGVFVLVGCGKGVLVFSWMVRGWFGESDGCFCGLGKQRGVRIKRNVCKKGYVLFVYEQGCREGALCIYLSLSASHALPLFHFYTSQPSCEVICTSDVCPSGLR